MPTPANMIVLDSCIFSGNRMGVQIGTGTGLSGTTVEGCSIVNSHFEAFSGATPSNPGGPTAIGLLLQHCHAPLVAGCGFQMDGDSAPSANAQRAIKCVSVTGGVIESGSFNGDGQCNMAIEIADAACENLVIQGNDFVEMNGYGLAATGTGALSKINVGPESLRWQ